MLLPTPFSHNKKRPRTLRWAFQILETMARALLRPTVLLISTLLALAVSTAAMFGPFVGPFDAAVFPRYNAFSVNDGNDQITSLVRREPQTTSPTLAPGAENSPTIAPGAENSPTMAPGAENSPTLPAGVTETQTTTQTAAPTAPTSSTAQNDECTCE